MEPDCGMEDLLLSICFLSGNYRYDHMDVMASKIEPDQRGGYTKNAQTLTPHDADLTRKKVLRVHVL